MKYQPQSHDDSCPTGNPILRALGMTEERCNELQEILDECTSTMAQMHKDGACGVCVFDMITAHMAPNLKTPEECFWAGTVVIIKIKEFQERETLKQLQKIMDLDGFTEIKPGGPPPSDN